MRCQDARDRFDDLLDGRIAAAQRTELEDHLASCPLCHGELEAVRSLRGAAARLPATVAPPRDLWPGIAARLETPDRRPATVRAGLDRRYVWLPLAAAAGLLLALGFTLLPRGPAPRPAGLTGTGLATAAPRAVSGERALLAALEERQDGLDAATVEALTESAELLAAAIGEVETALAENPTNPDLHLLLAERTRQEAKLAKQIRRLGRSLAPRA